MSSPPSRAGQPVGFRGQDQRACQAVHARRPTRGTRCIFASPVQGRRSAFHRVWGSLLTVSFPGPLAVCSPPPDVAWVSPAPESEGASGWFSQSCSSPPRRGPGGGSPSGPLLHPPSHRRASRVPLRQPPALQRPPQPGSPEDGEPSPVSAVRGGRMDAWRAPRGGEGVGDESSYCFEER